eukprot:16444658-Heterocapsa_arctica.AAC.1
MSFPPTLRYTGYLRPDVLPQRSIDVFSAYIALHRLPAPSQERRRPHRHADVIYCAQVKRQHAASRTRERFDGIDSLQRNSPRPRVITPL